MCFEFGSCFSNGRREDYGGMQTPRGSTRGRGGRADHRNGYYSRTDHNAPPAYHHQPHAPALDEVGNKPYHDGARKDLHAGGHGGYVQDKQADNDAPKPPPAWHNNKVAEDAGYAYTMRPHEAAADRRENYHHYPTATTNTTLVRYTS